MSDKFNQKLSAAFEKLNSGLECYPFKVFVNYLCTNRNVTVQIQYADRMVQ